MANQDHERRGGKAAQQEADNLGLAGGCERVVELAPRGERAIGIADLDHPVAVKLEAAIAGRWNGVRVLSGVCRERQEREHTRDEQASQRR